MCIEVQFQWIISSKESIWSPPHITNINLPAIILSAQAFQETPTLALIGID